MALCLQPKLSDFRCYPFEGPWEYTKTRVFQRNNCPSGQNAGFVSYSKTYTSNISEEHLEYLILQDTAAYNAAGQANANANGSCTTTPCTTRTVSPFTSAPIAVGTSTVWVAAGGGESIVSGNLSSYTNFGTNWLGTSPVNVVFNELTYANWHTMYPHTNITTTYSVYEDNRTLPITLYTRVNSPLNPCVDKATSTVIYHKKHPKGYVPHNNVLVLPGGVLFIVNYPHSTGIKGAQVCYYSFSTGNTTEIYYQDRPENHRYFILSSAITYDGNNAYAMLSFASNANNRRTRTTVIRINCISHIPYSGQRITEFGFSNQWLRVKAGCSTTGRVFFVYSEGGSLYRGNAQLRVQTIIGAAVPMPTLNMSDKTELIYGNWRSITPNHNRNIALLGPAGNSAYRMQYSQSTNSWSHV